MVSDGYLGIGADVTSRLGYSFGLDYSENQRRCRQVWDMARRTGDPELFDRAIISYTSLLMDAQRNLETALHEAEASPGASVSAEDLIQLYFNPDNVQLQSVKIATDQATRSNDVEEDVRLSLSRLDAAQSTLNTLKRRLDAYPVIESGLETDVAIEEGYITARKGDCLMGVEDLEGARTSYSDARKIFEQLMVLYEEIPQIEEGQSREAYEAETKDYWDRKTDIRASLIYLNEMIGLLERGESRPVLGATENLVNRVLRAPRMLFRSG